MPLRFIDCPHCGRGLLKSVFQFHMEKFHSEKATEITLPGRQNSLPNSQSRIAFKDFESIFTKTRQDPNDSRELKKTLKVPNQVNKASDTSPLSNCAKEKNTLTGKNSRKGEVKASAIGLWNFLQKEKEDKAEERERKLALRSQAISSKKPENYLKYFSPPPEIGVNQRKIGIRYPLQRSPILKEKYIYVTGECSCKGDNVRCFKCGGSGEEIKQLVTTQERDTTLFPKVRTNQTLGAFSNDARGGNFSIRESGKFDSRPLHDGYDDESSP